jgi:hypothetical protein
MTHSFTRLAMSATKQSLASERSWSSLAYAISVPPEINTIGIVNRDAVRKIVKREEIV